MPELPEVETIVNELKKKVLKRTFIDVSTDTEKLFKKPDNFNKFKKEIKGKKIKDIRRRGKNILFYLSGGYILLVHQKMTGHFLFGKWKKVKGKWVSQIQGPLLADSMNQFVHVVFSLDRGQLALSDLRKFAKIELWDEKNFILPIGPEPLERSFTFKKFKQIIWGKKGKIKQVLMDQKNIAGIGNIYSDEILFYSKINPFRTADSLSENDLKRIYVSIKKVLKKAIKAKGESFSDFRRLNGKKGDYDPLRKVYRREKEKCFNCGTEIKRMKIGQRSTYFCPKCQK